MHDSYIRFIDAAGVEVLSASLVARHLKPGDFVTVGGLHTAPQRKYVVTDLPATHHVMNDTGGASRWLTTMIVKPA